MRMIDPKLGILIGMKEDARRDAVHVAIIPMVAEKELTPGQRFMKIGIVDPFLKRKVKIGERFWLCLDPGTVTGMRHHWTHPGFLDDSDDPDSAEKLRTAVAWISDFARGLELGHEQTRDYEELMQEAIEYIHTGDCPLVGSGNCRDGDWETFWQHFTTVTGIETNEDWSMYRCSC